MAHVFLSYQHQYQETVVKLRDELQRYGFTTWFDEDDMVGSTLESMAQAVEEAAVMIMCMSVSYKTSKNCQKEVEYAERQNKPIIPIRVETGFKPDGWLGLSSGSKKVIDFSDPEKFDEKFEQLLKELAARGVEPTAVEMEEYVDEGGQDGEDNEEVCGIDGVGDSEDKEGAEYVEYYEEDVGGNGDGGDDDQDHGEYNEKTYESYVCCSCAKKHATISPDDNDEQY